MSRYLHGSVADTDSVCHLYDQIEIVASEWHAPIHPYLFYHPRYGQGRGAFQQILR